MVQGRALPSDSVYQGTDASLFCCINMDPRSFIDDDGVCSQFLFLPLSLKIWQNLAIVVLFKALILSL